MKAVLTRGRRSRHKWLPGCAGGCLNLCCPRNRGNLLLHKRELSFVLTAVYGEWRFASFPKRGRWKNSWDQLAASRETIQRSQCADDNRDQTQYSFPNPVPA